MTSSASSASDPRIGQILSDRYRVVRKIGDGGMGAVYEGEHVVIKRRVAIKVLHAQFAQNPEIVARFQREAEAATAIGHPNIVEVTDMGRFPDGTSYMVLEFLEGRDWAHDIKTQGAQPLGKCVHILEQVCDALDAAHAKGIVHRDLKPENVFLVRFRDDENFAKVLDFGISKVVDEVGGDRSLTQTGTALGTPYYMAPEQCQGKKDIDLRADIYSLGVMLFQALTAQYPFDDESYPMLVLKICTQAAPPLTQYRPDVPIELEHIVNRMLAKDRAHRFASCAELRAALRPFQGYDAAPVLAQGAPSTATQSPSVLAAGGAMTPTGTAYLQSASAVPAGTPYPAGMATPPRRSNVPLFASIAGVLTFLALAGAGAGAWFAFRGPEAEDPVVAASPPDDAPADQAPDGPQQDEAAPADDATPGEVPPAATDAADAPDEPAVAQPSAYRVEVVVQPEGTRAEILVDEVVVSTTGRFRGTVEPGPHDLVVRADGFEPWERRVQFPEDEPFEVVLERATRRGGRGRGGGRASPRPVAQPTPATEPPAPRPVAPRPSPRPPQTGPSTDPFGRTSSGRSGGRTVSGNQIF